MAGSPTARALMAMDAIQSRPGVTATELADRLGVTERAVRRYVEILRDAGIPVVSVRGRYGGYRIGRGVRLPPVVFSGPEALGLVMAVLDSPAGAPVADSLVGSGVEKLLRALPESVGRPASLLWQHTAAAPVDIPRPDVALTSALVEAVATGHRVRVGYRSGSLREWTTEVDPWAVVVRYGLWYLLCRLDSGDLRTYRIDRVLSVEQMTGRSAAPADLDAIGLLERNLGQGWPLQARVRFRAAAEVVQPWLRATMGVLEPDGDECVLVGSTNNPEMYAGEWLAPIPLPYVVEGGPELREAMADLARRLRTAVGPLGPFEIAGGVGVRTPGMLPTNRSVRNFVDDAPPLMAKLSDRFGRRAIYVLDVALFAVGSLVVILSHGTGLFAVLLAGRAIQGFGAGGIFPVASAVIGDTFPPEKRGGALGLIGAVFGIAFMIGPVLGGILLPLGWPWLFVINLPMAVVVIALAWAVLPHRRIGTGAFDWFGMGVLTVALTSLALGLGAVDTERFWASAASPSVWPWLLTSVVAWVVLVLVERRTANPVFPVVLFRRRQLALGYTLTAGAGIGEASLVFMPSLAVAALGVSAHVASYLLLAAAMAVGSPLAGRMLDKVGSKAVIVTGVAVMTLGMFLLSRTGSSLIVYCMASVLVGLGLSSLLGAPIRYVTLNETTAEERSSAQGLVNTFTSIGQLLSAAVVGAIAASSPGAEGYSDAFALIGGLGLVLLGAALCLKKRAVEAQEPTSKESARA